MDALASYDSSSEENTELPLFFNASDSSDDSTPPLRHQQDPVKRKNTVEIDDSFWSKKKKFEPDPSWLVSSKSNSVKDGDIKSINNKGSIGKLEFSEVCKAKDVKKKFSVHHHIKPYMTATTSFQCPSRVGRAFTAHNSSVNRVCWNCLQFSHLLLTCSMDGTAKVFDVLSDSVDCVRTVSSHLKGVKSCTWLPGGKEFLTGSFDYTARIFNAETGHEVGVLDHESAVTSVACHPVNPNLFVTGSANIMQLWDKRSASHVREFFYSRRFGQVVDLLFSRDGDTLFSCNQLVERDAADRSIIAWNMDTGAVVSNQIYQERYTVVRLKMHPIENNFLAQTQSNYIAQFSAARPYKMHRGKRFEGHTLKGYPSGFDISPDGSCVLSGSANGDLHVYDYRSSNCTLRFATGADVLTDVACHPVLRSTCACGTWAGSVLILK